MAGSIFLSYRREDTPAEARAIQLALERAFGPSRVFMDIGGIEPGEDFADKLIGTLRRCKAMVVVIGPRWLEILKARAHGHFQSTALDFVRMEIADALRDGKPVIPVLVGGARMPDQMEVYGEIMQLARHQAIEVRGSHFPADVTALVKALERIVGQRSPFTPVRLLAGALVLAALGGGLAFYRPELVGLPAVGTRGPAPVAGVVAKPAVARPPQAPCSYEPFSGAALPGGAATYLVVPANAATPCTLRNVNPKGRAPSGLALVRPPRWGRVEIGPNGVVDYMPPKDYVGFDHFAFASASEPYAVAVMIDVRPQGQAVSRTSFVDLNATCHVAPFRGGAMPGGSATVMTVRNTGRACRISNYPRPGQPPLELAIVRQPRNGSADAHPDGIMTYIPRPGFSGRDTFAYKSNNQPFAVSVNVVVRPAN